MHLAKLKSTVLVPAMAALLLQPSGTQAMPTAVSSMISGAKALLPLPHVVEARGFNGMGPVTLFRAVKDYLKDSNAYVGTFYTSSFRC